MHDPIAAAFEIFLGKRTRKDGSYRDPIITVWHEDPETDGTDDSCGWFIRLRHTDNATYEKIVKTFNFEWDRTFQSEESDYVYNCGWFTKEGKNVLSVQGIVLNMYLIAAKHVFETEGDPTKSWDKSHRFLNKYLAEILLFAENNTDSIFDTITRKFEIGTNTLYSREEMIRECAEIVYTDILRKKRKWYQHPKWHIHHWRIQFHPLQRLKRRYWDKCSICGKRGFKESAHSSWGGDKIWHKQCDDSTKISIRPKKTN